MGKNSILEIKGNFDLMKKTVSKLPQCWQRFREYIKHIDKILFIFVFLLFALVLLAGAVMVSKDTEICLQELLGLKRNEKDEVLKFIGFCIAGVVSIWLAWAANKRANAMDATARNAEAGQRQERLKNAIEHLGHKRDSVRMGGAHELFHLAKDTIDLRRTVLDILCTHIRQTTTGQTSTGQTTRGNAYQTEHKTKPSEEIQGLLTLLFREKHDIFEDCPINLQGSYLNGANLSQARLKKVNLIEAQLQDADFMEAQLQGAFLMEAQLQKADLRQAQLQKADLRQAKLQGAILLEARLQRAFLREAQLQKADLRQAKLQKATLWGAQLQDAVLEEAQLQGAALRYARLQGATLWLAQLQGAVLREAQLQKADLRYAQLQGAVLREAQLQGAFLRETQLQGASLWLAQMQGANLINAQLQGASLREAQLQKANLSEAQLQGAILWQAQMQGAVLKHVQLQGVSSQETDHLPSAGFESRIQNRIGKPSDLTGIIFAGGLQGESASHELPRDSGAKIAPPFPPYTQEEAEKWIAEYNKAMEGVPSANDTANDDSAPARDKDKED